MISAAIRGKNGSWGVVKISDRLFVYFYVVISSLIIGLKDGQGPEWVRELRIGPVPSEFLW